MASAYIAAWSPDVGAAKPEGRKTSSSRERSMPGASPIQGRPKGVLHRAGAAWGHGIGWQEGHQYVVRRFISGPTSPARIGVPQRRHA